MGSCISKCRPKKKHSLEEFHHVQDKLVISQTPKNPIPHSNKISPSPPSPTSSTSSISSLTCTTGNTTSSTSSLSTASSALSSKDRSFSNEFLWSCVKENPHIIRINSIRENALSQAATRAHFQKSDLLAKTIMELEKQSLQRKVIGSIPKKRVRSSSPAPLTRQKSFRKEPEWPNVAHSLPSRTLRSPSPSRRFNGDRCGRVMTNTTMESHSKRMLGKSSSMKMENLRSASPHNNSSRLRPCLRNRETCTHRIGSKIDEMAVTKALSHNDFDSIPLEDIDNPLISLDCFIFL
jgi:hypothetical protein|uniref:Uncharacterized protein n=1 Tax=Fagus sylvatica TaxID=28930 RepID=A0A2N9IUV0_FAGSY